MAVREALAYDQTVLEYDTHGQAADDLRYAVEMAGARGALHHLVDQSEIELPGVGLGIYLLDRGHQHEIRPGLFQQAGIGLRRAGVMLQVVFVVELRGVYEDAHHDGAVFPPGTFHERAVSCMQGAHRRYEADSRLLRLVQLCTELLDTFKYFHPFLMRVVRAKVEIPSDITKKKVGKISRIFFLCAPCRSEIPVFRPRRRMRFCKMRLSCEKGWHSLILFPDIA